MGYTVFLGLLFLVIYGSEGCSNGWIQHGDTCYFFNEQAERWAVAFDQCKLAFKANLVEVTSASENNFLKQEVSRRGGNFWVGGNDMEVEGEWKWMTSGQLVSYRDWYPGEPNNDNNQDCMHLTSSHWDDSNCHFEAPYICERGLDEVVAVG